MSDQPSGEGLYLALISVHGLIRGHDLELGRDPDTGGQTKYVVELSRALARQPGVARVDLFTRLIADPAVSVDYGELIEDLGGGARIVRIPAGPPSEYIRKEELWDHLDGFADNLLAFMRESADTPDIVHSHYADAGYVGIRVAHQLGVPLVHTGHSLGRAKRRRLLATGLSAEEIERRFHMARRIEAEENTLASAALVITSTHQEIEEQYGLYDHYQPERMKVVPPGTDLERFHPPKGGEANTGIAAELRRFLREPDKPIVLALSRPDPRKNIATLVNAYGASAELQALANLVIVPGNRDDIADMEDESQEVLTDLLLAIDRWDLYGKVAYPKHHQADDVPLIYRIAAASKGVFVNPALTEPFGLTLIEAAASGLPIVATEDGGPRDIVANCKNGLLVDPLEPEDIAQALVGTLSDERTWRRRAESGIKGVQKYYSWESHARSYLQVARPIAARTAPALPLPPTRRPMLYHDRAIFTDLDQNLLGDPDALPGFTRFLRANRKCATFGIATGRRLDSTLKVLRSYRIPEPDVLITSGGTEIYYNPDLTAEQFWSKHIDHLWTPHVVRRVLADLPGLELQPKSEQSRFKVSYFYDPERAPSLEEISRLLHHEEQTVNLTLSFGQFVDVLPIRASKGFALRYVTDRWGIPLEQTLVAGGSGADEDMMRGNTLGVVVANRYHEELSQLIDLDRIYFAKAGFANGILEAIDHYDFFGACRVPPEEPEQAV